MNNQPTNQPRQPPANYVSIRITIPHVDWPKFVSVFDGVPWYISYPHKGVKTHKEHFHVLVPGSTNADRERFRKRVKNVGLVGNECVSVKLYDNGVTSGITYAAHEKTVPFTFGDVQSWIDSAPVWVPKSRLTGKKRKLPDTMGIALNPTNVLHYAYEYHTVNKLVGTDLLAVLSIMESDGYHLSISMVRPGCPDFYLDVFKDAVLTGSLKWGKTNLRNLFRPLSTFQT